MNELSNKPVSSVLSLIKMKMNHRRARWIDACIIIGWMNLCYKHMDGWMDGWMDKREIDRHNDYIAERVLTYF